MKIIRGKRITLQCEFCKKKFYLLESVVAARKKRAKNSVRFCSQKCMGLASRKPNRYMKSVCKTCGKIFDKRKDHTTKNNYCSTPCFRVSRKGIKLSESRKKTIKKSMSRPDVKKRLSILNSRKRRPLTEKHKQAILISRGPWTDEQKAKVSNKLCGRMPSNTKGKSRYGNIKSGYYNINGTKYFFRSGWEANYARFLDFLVVKKKIKRWEYESDVFIFDKIKFGTRSYRPDFKVFLNNGCGVEYHEVKGYMDAKSKTKLNRMRIYYPDIKIKLIDSKTYKIIEKLRII